MGHHRQFWCETFDVLGFSPQVPLRDEKGEIGVLVTSRLDALIKFALQQLPDSIAVGANHHRPAHWPTVGELRTQDELVVPRGEVFALGCNSFFVCPGHLLSLARSYDEVPQAA